MDAATHSAEWFSTGPFFNGCRTPSSTHPPKFLRFVQSWETSMDFPCLFFLLSPPFIPSKSLGLIAVHFSPFPTNLVFWNPGGDSGGSGVVPPYPWKNFLPPRDAFFEATVLCFLVLTERDQMPGICPPPFPSIFSFFFIFFSLFFAMVFLYFPLIASVLYPPLQRTVGTLFPTPFFFPSSGKSLAPI